MIRQYLVVIGHGPDDMTGTLCVTTEWPVTTVRLDRTQYLLYIYDGHRIMSTKEMLAMLQAHMTTHGHENAYARASH